MMHAISDDCVCAVQAGASVNHCDVDRMTALMHAADGGSEGVVEALLDGKGLSSPTLKCLTRSYEDSRMTFQSGRWWTAPLVVQCARLI
jgi:hypothetical protein